MPIDRLRSVQGTPRWASVCAWLTLASVLPASFWRVAVGLGVPLGWSDEHLALERIPGPGTRYVITLSLVSIGAAALTLGLVQPWGERVPNWVPLLGGSRIPVPVAVLLATAGAVVVAGFVVLSILDWSSVSGFADRPTSLPALFMAACYLPVVAWPVLLIAVTWSYARRRSGRPITRGGPAAPRSPSR